MLLTPSNPALNLALNPNPNPNPNLNRSPALTPSPLRERAGARLGLRLELGIESHLAHFISSLWSKAGHLVRTHGGPPYHLSDCSSPAPCTCTWPTGLSATYTISGFSGLSTCSTCDASTDPAWDGSMHHTGAGCIWWAADASFDPRSIGGKMLDITYTQLLLNTRVTPCRWELYIACTSLINPTKTMWYGYKTTGATPAGTYSFVGSDCGNTTASMTVS